VLTRPCGPPPRRFRRPRRFLD